MLFFYAVGALLVFSVMASRLADRMGVPALVIYIGIGMLIGSDGLGWVDFSDAEVAQTVGSVAMAIILFTGGLDTEMKRVKEVAVPALLLSTVGVFLTAALIAIPVVYLLNWTWLQAFLLGSVVGSTDAAAVFAVIRSQGVAINPKIAALLEFESGSNDPMALLLVVAIIQWMTTPDPSVMPLLLMFVLQFIMGAVIGLGGGKLLLFLVNYSRLSQEGLYTVLVLGGSLVIYGLADLSGGNPFLAVYLAGIVLGNSRFVHSNSIRRFQDGMAWLMQVVVFLVLGLLASPSNLPDLLLPGLLIGAYMMLVARPLAVAAVLAPMRWQAHKIGYIGWVGLKGAVPIVLATFPLVAGIEGADTLLGIVFVLVLLSTTIQGSTVGITAKWTNLLDNSEPPPPSPLVFQPEFAGDMRLVDLVVKERSFAACSRVFELELPRDTLIVMVVRDGLVMVPRGELQLMEGDRLQVLVHQSDREMVEAKFVAGSGVTA